MRGEKKMKLHNSGKLSTRFWKEVNMLDDRHNVLYLMGCALQDIEYRMFQAMECRAGRDNKRPNWLKKPKTQRWGNK